MADDIAQWLERLGLGRHAQAFADNSIDVGLLAELTEDDLRELGLNVGERRRLQRAIRESAPQGATPTRESAPSRSTEARPGAERRQLTVMFCDLVGSTELSHRLDPEDMREVIRTYQNAVAGEIGRFEGHVAKFMGDGVLAYFGWPWAHEDDAERAVRAGLGIAAAVSRLQTPGDERLACRVGIATGDVVVGDLVGEGAAQEEAVVGETPNIAARLQTMAQPGQVLVSEPTRQLLADLFDLQDLGAHAVKGVDGPVAAFAVLAERPSQSRFEAHHAASILPLVGRTEELALLTERWRQAASGEGQCVLLTGEAGIGKSRITGALRDALAGQAHTTIRWQCSPYHADSTLWPAIQQLGHAAGFAAADANVERLDKLESLLRRGGDDVTKSAPLLADLLGIDASSRHAPLHRSAQDKRADTLAALAEQLMGLAAKGPVLFVIEDAHWADPTSLELLQHLVSRIAEARVLLLVTARPEFEDRLGGHPHVTRLTLNRLGRGATQAIATELAGREPLPTELMDLIVARTDGVPLYVEELTKAIIESGALRDRSGARPALAIPASLHGSLLARLDRLGPAKAVAQTAACIGRDFGRGLLAAVARLPAAELDAALDRLIASELVFRSGAPSGDGYRFKHALVRDAAYDSLLRGRRRQLHAEIAESLEAQSADIAQSQPELLAYHYTEGGLAERAIPYWQRAGERSARASADLEAIAHLKKGLQLIDSLPESSARARQALAICLTLGSALSNIEGSGGAEVGRIYLRARQLCETTGQPEQRFAALWGLWAHHHMSARLAKAQHVADEVVALAERLPDSGFRLQAHHAAWTARHAVGDLSSALHHAGQGVSLYDIDRHRFHAFVYAGHDPGICAGWHMAELKWQLGFPDQALRHAQDLLSLGERLSHPMSWATAQSVMIVIRAFRGESTAALALAEQMLTFTTEHKIAIWRANATMLKAWVEAALGRGSDGIDAFRDAVEQRAARGAVLRQSFYLALLAEAYGFVDRPDRGVDATDRALALVASTGERRWESLIHRVRATLLASSSGTRSEAEAGFAEALKIARSQEARALELQAALGLARLWQRTGERRRVADLLGPIYASFREGFDTTDLKEAGALLGASSKHAESDPLATKARRDRRSPAGATETSSE